MINILIVDDHKILVDSLRVLIEKEENINIIGFALNGEDVIELQKRTPADVILMDVSMPGLGGYESVKILKRDYPKTKILILTLHKEPGIISKMLNVGVDGYLIKEKGGEELIKAINSVSSGEDYYDSEVKDIIINSLKNPVDEKAFLLTKREQQVLKLIGQGLSSREIAETLFIAESTVETHRRNLLEKLNLPNSKQLIIYANNNAFTE